MEPKINPWCTPFPASMMDEVTAFGLYASNHSGTLLFLANLL